MENGEFRNWHWAGIATLMAMSLPQQDTRAVSTSGGEAFAKNNKQERESSKSITEKQISCGQTVLMMMPVTSSVILLTTDLFTLKCLATDW